MSPVLDRLRRTDPVKGITIPTDIRDRVKRAREAKAKDRDKRRMYVKFWQGEQYWYVKDRGGLGLLPTALDAVGKQQHRIRNTYNYIHHVVEGKTSAATQRIPGYEVDPSSSDPEDIAGARLSQQVAFYGYDKWRLRRVRTKAVTNALVQREGFVMPYFDQNVGPFTPDPVTGRMVGQGEIKFLSLSRTEVGWEPGVDFEDSPYWIIERAYLREEAERLPGFVGGNLTNDAKTSDLPSEKTTDQMVVVTHYLERPCPDYPDGRSCWIANDQAITDYRKIDPDAQDWWEHYPAVDEQGQVVDELVIHRISYTVDPEGDDRGMVEHIIDLQRTILDCWNKLLEIKNRALLLQMIAPKGSKMPRRNDEMGATYEYNPTPFGNGQIKPEWEKPPDPAYIHQLLQLLREAKDDLRALAADVDVQAEPDLAARTAQAAIEQSRSRWQSFLGDLAEFDSRLMRHCLMLVGRHYRRERIIQIRGQYGWEPPVTLTGQDLRSQVNIRVFAGSLEVKTRQAVLEQIQFVQANWPGALRPEVAMAALNGGNAEGLFKSYEYHVARAWRLVQMIRSDFRAVLELPARQDLEAGDQAFNFMVPGWMPRKQDNLVIWKQVIGDYMITPDFDEQPLEAQTMFDTVWGGLEWLEQQRVLKLAAQQLDAASSQGQANAAKPQGAIPPPAVNGGLSREEAAPTALTPE